MNTNYELLWVRAGSPLPEPLGIGGALRPFALHVVKTPIHGELNHFPIGSCVLLHEYLSEEPPARRLVYAVEVDGEMVVGELKICRNYWRIIRDGKHDVRIRKDRSKILGVGCCPRFGYMISDAPPLPVLHVN